MKLVSYNIQYGIGRDGRSDLERIAASVEAADVIALQEVTQGFSRNGGVDMVAGLKALLPGHFSAHGPAMDIDAGSAMAGGKAVDRRCTFGNMIFSRYPIAGVRNLLLPRTRTYDVLNLQRGALEAVIVPPGSPALRVYSVHLDHIAGEERLAQIAWLRNRVLGYGVEGGAVTGAVEFGLADPPETEDYVLMGDFNMEPESPEYIAMVGQVEKSGRRIRRADRAVDAATVRGQRPADAYSWTDMNDAGKRQHLDYCFVNPRLADRVVRCETDHEAAGSDHQPVWLDLSDHR